MARAGVVWAAASCLASVAVAQETYVWSGIDRVVAIGDVHGAYEELKSVLQGAGLIDDSLQWTGGSAHLVSLGDLMDRGPNSKAVMDLLMSLGPQAAAAGGQVHVVLGNHEVMNLIGDLRYVSPTDYASYADDNAAALRETAFRAYVASLGDSADEAEARQQFDNRYPLGYFGHFAAFSPDGKYGQWLLSLPTIIVINGTAYVHGGLPKLVADSDLATINTRVRAQIRRLLEDRSTLVVDGILPKFDMRNDYRQAQSAQRQLATQDPEAKDSDVGKLLAEFLSLQNSNLLGPQGPLWYRGAIYCKPILEAPVLDASLTRLDAKRVVVGHTPTSNRQVDKLYGGKLILLDTGMLRRYYSGHPAALISDASGDRIQYADPPGQAEILDGRREIAYGMTRPEVVQALTEGDVSVPADTQLVTGTQLKLSYNGKEITTVFYASDGMDSAQKEASSYMLDSLLDFELVPPTVFRSVGTEEGALQLVYPDSISEQQRLDEKRGLGGWCDISAELQLVYTFDALIANAGRSAANLSYVQEASDIVLTQHANAFATSGRLPSALRDGAIQIEPSVAAALGSLNADELSKDAGDWLSSRQIKALLSRRDELVDRFSVP